MIWNSVTTVECLLNKVVVLHYEVNFGIWVDTNLNTNARLVKKIDFN